MTDANSILIGLFAFLVFSTLIIKNMKHLCPYCGHEYSLRKYKRCPRCDAPPKRYDGGG